MRGSKEIDKSIHYVVKANSGMRNVHVEPELETFENDCELEVRKGGGEGAHSGYRS